jgi:3-methyladenine DNA glycosylase AlkD
MNAAVVKAEILQEGSPEKAAFLSRFFKTGKGQYAEGDIFAGVNTPVTRAIVKKHQKHLTLPEVKKLLKDPIHECRLAAVVWLSDQMTSSRNQAERAAIVDVYLNHLDFINNWDLVDVSCPRIIGAHLLNSDRSLLVELAQRPHLWAQRIAMVSTLYFIQRMQFGDALRIAEMLLPHRHDLIHKAIGWMLREVGKRDELVLVEFLDEHISRMPRTSLRYAIERFPEPTRKYYLHL